MARRGPGPPCAGGHRAQDEGQICRQIEQKRLESIEVDLGDRTLVYDTFLAPQAAVDLRTAAEALTGRPVDAVIDSHRHNDHIWGNQAFSPTTDIIATGLHKRPTFHWPSTPFHQADGRQSGQIK